LHNSAPSSSEIHNLETVVESSAYESVPRGFGRSPLSAKILLKGRVVNRRTDMQMSLSDDEATLLARIVREYYSSLREEIYKTDTFDVKDELKREESILKGILDKLS
jgi:hypothetical protein